jgi:hypothetical protein
MPLSEKITPAFAGTLEFAGRGEAFLDRLAREDFTPTGFTGPRANYRLSRVEEGLLVEAADLLTAINIGLERVALTASPAGPGRFRLDYQVLFPRWARFCWTISLCTTLVPVALLTGGVFLVAAFFPGARVFADNTVLNPLYLLAVLPWALLGLALPPLLVAYHKPRARQVLERSLQRAAERSDEVP